MDIKSNIQILIGIIFTIIVVYLYFIKSKEEEDPASVDPVAPTDTTVAPTDTTVVAPTDTTVVAPTDTTVVAPTDTTVVAPTAILDTPQQNITLDKEEVEPENNNDDDEQEEAKKETVVPIPINNNNYTKFYNNDWEHGDKEGNFNRTFYLDGHNVNCGKNNFIKNFALQEDKQKKNYRYKYLCDTKVEGFSNYNSKENYENAFFEGPNIRHTAFNAEGGGNVIYLDRHDVKCNGLVNQFKLNRKDGKYRYSYSCYEPPSTLWKLLNTKNKKTKVKKHAWGRESSKNLLSAKIECTDPADKDIGLTGFRYNNDGYYDYTCGKIVKKTEEELEKEKKANNKGGKKKRKKRKKRKNALAISKKLFRFR